MLNNCRTKNEKRRNKQKDVTTPEISTLPFSKNKGRGGDKALHGKQSLRMRIQHRTEWVGQGERGEEDAKMISYATATFSSTSGWTSFSHLCGV